MAASAPAGPPLEIHRLDIITARALGIDGAGALPVRPEGRAGSWVSGGGPDWALRAAVRVPIDDVTPVGRQVA
jgi:hypothetical protein